MSRYRIILCSFLLFITFCSFGQQFESREEVDTKSYRLYTNAQWRQLLDYGKVAVSHKQDFILLRLRMAYAAFMLTNYSQAIKQYDVILMKDQYNETARYYKRLCLQYLQQSELANFQNKFIPTVNLKNEEIGRAHV